MFQVDDFDFVVAQLFFFAVVRLVSAVTAQPRAHPQPRSRPSLVSEAVAHAISNSPARSLQQWPLPPQSRAPARSRQNVSAAWSVQSCQARERVALRTAQLPLRTTSTSPHD